MSDPSVSPNSDKVYCVFLTRGDGCTYSCTSLHKIFHNKSDAETEVTRIELLQLEMRTTTKDFYKEYTLDEQDLYDCGPVVEEWEVH